MIKIQYCPPGVARTDLAHSVVFASRQIAGIDGVLSKNLRGLDGLKAEISKVKLAGENGSVVQKITLPERVISDTGVQLLAADGYTLGARKEKITSVLDSTRGIGTLYIMTPHASVYIPALPSKNGELAETFGTRFCKISVEFTCPNPYFRGTLESAKTLARMMGGQTGTRTITASFSVASASAVYPVITVNGFFYAIQIGAFTAVAGDDEHGATIIIDSFNGTCKITKNGETHDVAHINGDFPMFASWQNTFDIVAWGVPAKSAETEVVGVTAVWGDTYAGV